MHLITGKPNLSLLESGVSGKGEIILGVLPETLTSPSDATWTPCRTATPLVVSPASRLVNFGFTAKTYFLGPARVVYLDNIGVYFSRRTRPANGTASTCTTYAPNYLSKQPEFTKLSQGKGVRA